MLSSVKILGVQPWHPPLTGRFVLCSAGRCEGCWRCLIVWILKRNLQLHPWEWTATIAILQHWTTAPNRSLWPLRRRTRKPGCVPSSQEEGIKVKYQHCAWLPPSLPFLLVTGFCVCFLPLVPFCFSLETVVPKPSVPITPETHFRRGGGVQSVAFLSMKRH